MPPVVALGVRRRHAPKQQFSRSGRAKHGAQVASLSSAVVQILRAHGELGDGSAGTVVELGAGRGLCGRVMSALAGYSLTVVERRAVHNGFERRTPTAAFDGAHPSVSSEAGGSGDAVEAEAGLQGAGDGVQRHEMAEANDTHSDMCGDTTTEEITNRCTAKKP